SSGSPESVPRPQPLKGYATPVEVDHPHAQVGHAEQPRDDREELVRFTGSLRADQHRGELPDADLGDTAVTQLADIEPPVEVQGRRVQRHLLVLTEHVVTELHLDNGATTRRAA